MRKPTIRFYLADISGCGYYRIIQPVKAIRRSQLYKTPMIPECHIQGGVNPTDVNNTDIAVFQRSDNPELLQVATAMKMNGTKIIYDLDDWVFGVDPESPSYEVYSNPEVINVIKGFLFKADLVTVSTDYLARLLKPYNANIKKIQNNLDFRIWDRFYRSKKANSKITIGWAGSPSHYPDIIKIKDVIINILKDYPNVRLKIVGWDFSGLPEFAEVKNQIVFVPHVGPTQFGRLISDFDIGIAPLKHSDFNRAKSNVKFLEYSALAIPTVATDIEPYSEIENDYTGIKCKSYQDWYNNLNYLINSEYRRRIIGMNARRYVRTLFNIETEYLYRVNIYNNFVNQINQYIDTDKIKSLLK